MKTFLLFTLSILWLVFSAFAADATPKTITASSSNGSLLWPTNFFSANSNSIWTVLGGGETGVLAIERGGTGTTNAAGLRGVIGLDAGDPGSMGTNWLTLTTAGAGRGVLGLDVAAPGALGTNLLTQATAGGVRGLIGLDAVAPGAYGTNWLTLSTVGAARTALGLDEAGPGALGTNWLVLTTAAGGRSALGMDVADPGAMGTNILTQSTAAGARSLIGLDAGDPAALGTNWLTLSTAGDGRSALGLGEWGTNLYFGLSTTNTSVRFATAADDTTIVGVRFAGNTNVSLLSMSTVGNGLLLTEADGTTPFVPDDISPSGVMNYSTLTNLFVLSTNSYGVLPLLDDDPAEIATADHGRIYSKIGQKARVTLFGQTLSGSTNLAAEVVMVGPDAVATVDTIILGSTNIIEGIAGKQPYDAQLDEWASVSTNSVTALGVGAMTATSVDIGATNVVAAISGKQDADAQLDEWAGQGTNSVSLGAVVIGTTNVVGSIAGKQPQIVVADLTALAAYSGAEDSVLVSDAATGGTFAKATGLVPDGVVVVTNTGTANVFQRQYTGWANVAWWGADGSDADDDTVALQAAANWAAATKISGTRLSGQKTLYIPDGKYYLTNTVTFLCNVRCDTGGATFSCTDSGTVVVGTTSYNLFYPQITLPNISWSGTPRAAGSVGVTFINLYYADVSGFRCERFETGMLVTAGPTSLGTAYSRFANGALYENKVQLKLDPSTSGWVNDNSFISISFDAAGYRVRDDASHDLYVDGDTWPPDNTRFVNCSFESDCQTWFAYFAKGSNFSFRDCRYENYDGLTSTNYVKSGGTVTMKTDGAHDLVDGDVMFTSEIASGITMKHRLASNCTADTFDYTLSGGDIVDTASTNTVFRSARMWLASGVRNVLVDGGMFADRVYVDNVAAANVPAVRTTELVTASSGYTSYGVPPFRARNYTDTKASFAVYAAASTNAFQADESGATNWLAGLATDSLTIRKSGDVVPSMKLGTNSLSFGDGTAARDVTLTRSAANTVTLDATAYLDRLGVGPTTPIVNDTYALSSVRKDHTGVSGIMVQNATNATGARAQYTMNGPTGLAYLGVAPSTASSAWANRAYIYTEDSKYSGLTLYWGNQTSDLKIYDSSVSERYRFASNGIAIKNVRAIPTAAVDFGWIYAHDRTSAGGNSAPWVLTEDNRRGPVAFGDRLSVTTSLASFAGERLTSVISGCESGWTLSAAGDFTLGGTSYAYTNDLPASIETVTMHAAGGLRYGGVYDVTLALAGACLLADSYVELSLGGNVIGQIANGESSFSATARCGSVSTNFMITMCTTNGGHTRIEFDTVNIVPWASGDLIHSHSYAAASLVPSASAAPYFEFSASGSNAGTAAVKTNIIALSTNLVATVPEIIAEIVTPNNGGNWVMRGKVFATATDDYAIEATYIDPNTTTNVVKASTDLARWYWAGNGYIYFGARDDSADSGVTINASSVEMKP